VDILKSQAISLAIFNRAVAVFALKRDRKPEAYKYQKRKGAVEKVFKKDKLRKS
jgi:hypothetical protein